MVLYMMLRSVVLQRSARKEIDQARNERDPTLIARLIFVGYDCLNKTKESVSILICAMCRFMIYVSVSERFLNF
jgi:hypothetical protein